MSAPEPRSAEAARRFFIVCPPPDSKWFVEEVLIPLLAEHFASFAAQECAVLQAALTEAQEEPIITMTDGKTLQLGEVADAYDTLQRRVEALEKFATHKAQCHSIILPHDRLPCHYSPKPCPGCTCGFEAALRGGETG